MKSTSKMTVISVIGNHLVEGVIQQSLAEMPVNNHGLRCNQHHWYTRENIVKARHATVEWKFTCHTAVFYFIMQIYNRYLICHTFEIFYTPFRSYLALWQSLARPEKLKLVINQALIHCHFSTLVFN